MLTIDINLSRQNFQLQMKEQLALHGVTGVMGPSGCGKTTLLRCLAGLETLPNSSIYFGDQVWQSAQVCLPSEQRRIGYIFQDGRLFPHLDVLGNLQFAQKRQPANAQHRPDLQEIAAWLGIEQFLKRDVASLSGGQRQRVAIARALMMAPQLLLMDEPLAALDWTAKATIIPRLRELGEHYGIPVLFVSHDREEMARLADELLLLDNGRICQRGAVRQLLNQSRGKLADSHALSMLTGKVIGHDSFGMTELDVDSYRVIIDHSRLNKGDNVRVVVPAIDVSIALHASDQISIQNQLPTTITAIHPVDNNHTLVQLQLRNQSLLSLISQRACRELALHEGMGVYALFKASGLDVV